MKLKVTEIRRVKVDFWYDALEFYLGEAKDSHLEFSYLYVLIEWREENYYLTVSASDVKCDEDPIFPIYRIPLNTISAASCEDSYLAEYVRNVICEDIEIKNISAAYLCYKLSKFIDFSSAVFIDPQPDGEIIFPPESSDAVFIYHELEMLRLRTPDQVPIIKKATIEWNQCPLHEIIRQQELSNKAGLNRWVLYEGKFITVTEYIQEMIARGEEKNINMREVMKNSYYAIEKESSEL